VSEVSGYVSVRSSVSGTVVIVSNSTGAVVGDGGFLHGGNLTLTPSAPTVSLAGSSAYAGRRLSASAVSLTLRGES
jgi:hypothetical protein